ncbi:unnamed protein product [Didymodactylos carnosus]|uniref:Retrotransposon gag domain-containing protein n=1 Tax=Didymodactylos carnosus TaxID=1234261 RepID=A0A8S2KQE1_9BILA|nr:unnamed protein product [Didymodactylos carnosus]CAF3864047.1 unnamed protein product [Didymodactylos carnosus]
MDQDLFHHILVTLTEKALFETPYKFSGVRDGKVENWLKYLINNFDVISMSDGERLSIIHTFLCDDALLWYTKRKNDIKTWSAFIEQIQHEYSVEEQQASQDEDGQRKFQPIVYHQQHLRRTYDHYSETIVLEETIAIDSGDLAWPEQGELCVDWLVKEQRERFRNTPINESDALNAVINTGTQLSITSKVREVLAEDTEQGVNSEVNDDRQVQLQNSIIQLVDEDRALLLSKLYDAMEHLQVKKKAKPLSLSLPVFQFALSGSGLSSNQLIPFRGNTNGRKGLLTTVIADICPVLEACRTGIASGHFWCLEQMHKCWHNDNGSGSTATLNSKDV